MSGGVETIGGGFAGSDIPLRLDLDLRELLLRRELILAIILFF